MIKEFIKEYGENVCQEVFEAFYGNISKRVEVVERKSLDREGGNHSGVCILDGTIVVIITDGNWNGSEIHDYGNDLYTGIRRIDRNLKINRHLNEI